jgi:hypothetical protein
MHLNLMHIYQDKLLYKNRLICNCGEKMCDASGYDSLTKKMKDNLGLKKSPVAIKFVLREENIPEGIPKTRQKEISQEYNLYVLM